MQLVEMIKNLERFDLHDVFYIVKTTEQADESLKQETSTTPLYLLNDYAKISIQEIGNSICFFPIYRQCYHIQNLEWSDLFMKGSCDDSLKKKVMEYLFDVPSIEKGGPLFFKVMMTIISSNTEEAICTLTKKVSTFKITSIQGENINTAVSQPRGAYRHFDVCRKDYS